MKGQTLKMISAGRIADQYVSCNKIFGGISKEIDAYHPALSPLVFVLKGSSYSMFFQVS